MPAAISTTAVWSLVAVLLLVSNDACSAGTPVLTPPPASFFDLVGERDRDAARNFYAKYASANGLPIVASEEVADQALVRACEIVDAMLAGRPDILEQMVDNGMYLIIIGKDQVYTDMPENRHVRDKDFMNERVRGTGGKPTSFGEENLLSLALDRYDDESIAVHEFSHTIDGTLRSLDSDWRDRLQSVYRSVCDQGKYVGAYARGNPGEYWAEAVQAYFDCNRVNNWNHGPVGTREVLRTYDPEGYELVRSTFQLEPESVWRYSFLQSHPVVISPPQRFKIPGYYTKFSWAREFCVVGNAVSDEALLKVNDTVRKMFAYRHDLLKTLINDDAKLVVLGENERLADLPEWAEFEAAGASPGDRQADYLPATATLVVPSDAAVKPAGEISGIGNPVVYSMAKAFYGQVAVRAIDPNWENRGRDVQQYELNVRRLDERFGKEVRDARANALKAGLWSGTAASSSDADYLASGVVAYFDAGGSTHPAPSREELQGYDPALHTIVHETMAYEGRVDWRFHADQP
ncbi:hypothetical protein Pla123a_32360 [Posidoniimonas polymericola]|uniref:Uncharacterized protein n=1 Tax=Posidoniimonas polymericola TaxID=2528002 RepID=A0A5C5YLL0_9BACT|nr:hypothetical protein [Posidoniimonas polymericola]TWT75726.1 hypothetical protein Pla123a_32360 [Posidoniimonas polymericola]